MNFNVVNNSLENNHCHGNQCCQSSNNTGVQQSLDELSFCRGIWNAALDGDLKKLEFFLKKVDPDSKDSYGYTPLHYASRNGQLEACWLLLNSGADVNSRTRSGKSSALHRAAYIGDENIVKLLIKHSANVLIQDDEGKTALHKAAENNHCTVVRILLDQEPDLKLIKDYKGNLPILND